MPPTPPAHPPDAPATLAPGVKVGPYEVIAPLGAGAMGEVWRARDPRLERQVAIKVLPGEFARDPERLRRFQDEARAAGNLNHPNVVTVYDTGTFNGAPYVVHELLEGTTLRERLLQGPVLPRRATEWAVQIARGLAAAHEKGVVHRDLKPENLIVLPEGRLKVLDFGLAKLTRPSTDTDSLAGTMTEAGTILGTAGYMSPEQVRGESADARSDLFALGVIVHEMLSGRRPFQGDSAVETLNAILREDPPPLEPPVPPGLARIVQRLLEKQPAERFQSARDLAFALESLSESGVGMSAPSGAAAPAATAPPQARGVRAAALALAALAGVVIGGVLVMMLARPEPATPPRLRAITFSGHDVEPAISPDGRTVAFVSTRDGARRIWIKELATGGEQALTDGSDAMPRFSPDGSTILYTHVEGGGSNSIYRVSVVGGEHRRILDDALDGDWSPDGFAIAFVRVEDELYELWTAKPDGSAARRLYRAASGSLGAPRWSPDGRRIAFARATVQNASGNVTIVSVADARATDLVHPEPTGDVSSVAWLDDQTIAYAMSEGSPGQVRGRQSRVIVHPLRGGRPREVMWLPGPPSHVEGAGLGRLLIGIPAQRQNLQIVPVAGGEPRWLTHGGSIDRQPSFSPDGSTIVFSSNRSGNLDLWSVSLTGGTIQRVTDDAADDWDPEFAPDGRSIWWSSNRSGAFEIWTAGVDGSHARQVSRDSVDAENPTLGPDDAWVIYGSTHPERSGVWKMRADGSEAQRLTPGNIFLPEISPDGRHVAYSTLSRGGTVEVRVLRTEDGAHTPFAIRLSNANPLQVVGRVRWRPDGRALAFTAESEGGALAIYEQDFDAGRNTNASRRRLAGGDPASPTESFCYSPDGRSLVLSVVDPLRTIYLAENVIGTGSSRASRR